MSTQEHIYFHLVFITLAVVITSFNITLVIKKTRIHQELVKQMQKKLINNESLTELIKSVLSRSSLDSLNFTDYFEKEMKEIKKVIKQMYPSNYSDIESNILPTLDLSKLISEEFNNLVNLRIAEASKYEDDTVKFNKKVGIFENTKIGIGDKKDNDETVELDLSNIFSERDRSTD